MPPVPTNVAVVRTTPPDVQVDVINWFILAFAMMASEMFFAVPDDLLPVCHWTPFMNDWPLMVMVAVALPLVKLAEATVIAVGVEDVIV